MELYDMHLGLLHQTLISSGKFSIQVISDLGEKKKKKKKKEDAAAELMNWW